MNFKVVIAFVTVYFVWGSTFGAIKIGLESFAPFWLAALRFALAASVFFVLANKKEIRSMTKKEVINEGLIGMLLCFSNAGVCWTQQFIPSGIAALIVGSLPVMFILLNWFGFEKKAPHPSALLAFGIGISGILLLSMDKTAISNWWVVAALVFVNSTWVCGSLLIRMSGNNKSYFSKASIQLGSGSLFLVLLSFLMGEKHVSFGDIPLSAYLSVLYLGGMGTVIAYTAYSYLLKNVKPEMVSTYALVNPVVALILGVLFLDEVFTVNIAYASGLILMSVLLVLYGEKLFIRLVPAFVSVKKNPNVLKEHQD